MFLHQVVICSHLAGAYRIDVGLTWFAWPHPLNVFRCLWMFHNHNLPRISLKCCFLLQSILKRLIFCFSLVDAGFEKNIVPQSLLDGGFQLFFISTPQKWSNLANIFQMGWFNHHPELMDFPFVDWIGRKTWCKTDSLMVWLVETTN